MLRWQSKQTLLMALWAVLICCVIIGELLPAASPVMVAIGRLHIWDKLQHFSAYLALSFLPVIGFRPAALDVRGRVQSQRCRANLLEPEFPPLSL